MPTRRLVVALTVLLLGVFGVGIVTALGRIDDEGTPSAQPTPSFSQPPFTTEPTTAPPTDQPTDEPTPAPTSGPTREPNATSTPTGAPTGEPTAAPTGTAKPDVPNMPNTGAPLPVAVAAVLVLGTAVVTRRAVR